MIQKVRRALQARNQERPNLLNAKTSIIRSRSRFAMIVVAVILTILGSRTHADEDFGARITNADKEPQNWLSTGRNYQETRHSPLTQINTSNVSHLGLAWFYDLDTNRGQESTPIEVDGKLYTTSAWSKVQAFDAVSGRLLWQFDPRVPGKTAVNGCCDVVNRGAAYWNGRVFVGTIDGRLIALDANTGALAWSAMTVDPSKPYTITSAPRIIKGNVIIGNGGSDMGGGVRGYLSAYDADTGKIKWRFFVVPGPHGRADHAASDAILAKKAFSTWSGKWWSNATGGGGGSPWDAMAYDPELNLLYVGTGNGNVQAGKIRSPDGGDNLFTCSILALRPETGEYVWHYQEVPDDQWDYDATEHMILTDLKIDGRLRKVLLQASKDGFFYVIDRTNGHLISAKPYSKVNWAEGIDPKTARPILNPAADYGKTGKIWIAIPGSLGAHDWQPMTFDPETQLVYIPAHEIASAFALDKNYRPLPKGVNTGLDLDAVSSSPEALKALTTKFAMRGYLLAWDPVKQREVWRVDDDGPWQGGMLSTAGHLLFEGTDDRRLYAYDVRTGEKLWSFDTQSSVMAAPVTFSVGTTQYVSVVVGRGGPYGLAFPLVGPHPINRGRVLTFALDARGALPAVEMAANGRMPPPAQFGTSDQIKLGQKSYDRVCIVCHGVAAISGGVTPDLRYSPAIGNKAVWTTIVADGALAGQGMVSFKDDFTADALEAIRAYLIDRARAAAESTPAAAPSI